MAIRIKATNSPWPNIIFYYTTLFFCFVLIDFIVEGRPRMIVRIDENGNIVDAFSGRDALELSVAQEDDIVVGQKPPFLWAPRCTRYDFLEMDRGENDLNWE